MMREMSREEALERIEFRVRHTCPEANGSNIGECSGCWRYPCNEMKAVGLLAQERPHGEWVDVPKYKGFYVCSKCLERLGGDFERFDHWEMKKENFCPVCGSDNRKKGGTK